MKSPIVILILAGKIEPLQGLLDVIGERFHVIIHLDAKIGAQSLRLPAGAVLIDNRLPIFWGGFNMVLAIRDMITMAYREFPHFERILTITGDTLPVIELDDLEGRLMDYSVEYMHLGKIPDDPSLRGISQKEAAERKSLHAWRIQNYIFSDDEFHSPRSTKELAKKFNLSDDQAGKIRFSVQSTTQEIFQNMPPRPRLFESLYYGNSWWSLTRQALNLIIDDTYADINVLYFKYLNVPDEHFFQTLLGNKTRAMLALGRRFNGRFVFVDYENPERKRFRGMDFLTVEGFRNAGQTGWLFARKYVPAHTPEIADAIVAGRFFAEIL